MESVILDELDHRLIHALQLDGRAPLRHVAAVLHVPERTLVRRYQRLRTKLILRVAGRITTPGAGRAESIVRIQCTAGTEERLAAVLSRRADTSWVATLAGRAELTGIFTSPLAAAHLPGKLSQLPHVQAATAARVLRYVAGVGGWQVRLRALSPAEQDLLRYPTAAQGDRASSWTDQDAQLATALARDGRASIAALAAATGWSAPTVRARIAEWRAAGVLSFEAEIDPAFFGYQHEALLWLEVAPAALAAAIETLNRQPSVAFAATTAGPTQLFVIAECRQISDLHDLLTTELAGVAGITRADSAFTQHRTKRTGSLLMPG